MGELLRRVRELHVEAGRREHLFGLPRVVPSNGGTPGRQPEDDGHDHGASQAVGLILRVSPISAMLALGLIAGPPCPSAALVQVLRREWRPHRWNCGRGPWAARTATARVRDKRTYCVDGTPALPGRTIRGPPLGVGIVIGGSTTCPSGVRCAK